jgi:transposase
MGMAKRTFILSEADAQTLRAQYDRCPHGATRSRYQAVWMYGTGYPVAEIVKLVGCSRSSLMNWCRTYLTRGPAGLEDERKGGNSAKLTTPQRIDLQARLQTYTPAMVLGPEAATPTGEFWTVPDVQRAVARWYGVTYRSLTSYRQLLLTSGFSYQRPAKVFKSRRPSQVAEFEEAFEKKSSTSSRERPTR